MQRILAFSRRANRYAPIALPLVTVEILVLLFVFHVIEEQDVWQSRFGIGWSIYIPGWLSGGVFIAASISSTAYYAYLRARDYPFTANAATIAGIATTCTLMWWPTQQCDQMGGLTAGITVACVIVAVAMVVNSQAGKVRQGTTIDDGAITAQPNAKPEDWRIGIVPFLQISLAAFMAIIVLMAFTNDDLTESRTELLLFAGIGITAASIISAERSLKSALAMSGAAVSLVGAYLEMSQALTSSGSETGALTILVAAGLVAGIVIMFVSFDAHVVVRLAVTPFLTAVAAAGITLLITMTPVLFISAGCSVPVIGTYFSALTSGLLAVIAGSVTFAVLVGIAASDWWTSRRAAPQDERK